MPSKWRQAGLGALSATLVLLLFSAPAMAAAHGKKNPPIFVIHDFKHDVSPPLRSIRPIPPPIGPPVVHEHELLPPGINQLPPGARPSGSTPSAGSVLQTQATPFGPAAMPTTSQNFEGVGDGLTGFTVQNAPPDTEGDVGLKYYVQWVNTSFAVFDKSNGNVVYGPALGSSLWSGFGGYCQTANDGDPIVQYDQIANRWVMTQFANVSAGPPYYQCIAVSTSSDPTGTWYRYGFQWPTGYLNDYPKLGVWPDGYYLTVNQFNGNTFMGAGVAVFDRSAMLTGAAATIQEWDTGSSYGGLLPSDLDGSTLPPAGEPDFQVAFGTNSLLLWKLHVDWTTPANSTFTGPTAVSGVAAFASACGGGTCIPQPGVAQQLDSLADRLMYRLAYRNFGTYEALVVNHSVNAGGGVSGVRWYEIRDPNGAPTVYQQGTYSPDSSYRWMGSIAQDKDGDMALGYSVSDGTSVYPSIRYTGRLASDTLGTMPQGESSLQAGSGSQGPNLSRWGDYSSMSIDPADDCTFWYTNEYLTANGTFNWHTRIGSFKYPTCVTCSAAIPTGLAVSANGDNSIQLTWTAAVGAIEYRIYRSLSATGSFQQIGTSATNSYVDNTAQGGITYYYEVTNYDGTCESSPSTAASGSTTGTCNLAPSFAGVGSVSNSYVSGCTLDLSWSAATSLCGGAVTYTVYRSTSSTFTPSSSNRIALGVSGTSYTDISALQYGQTYYYIVRAVDGGNGAEDSNTTTQSGSPYGPQVASVLYPAPPASAPQTFDACTGLCGWTKGTFVAGGSTTDWRGVQSCSPTHSGANVFRFGGNGCNSNYSSNDFAFAEPPGFVVPAGSTNVRLDFWHRWSFESGYDGGLLALSFDGANYTAVPASAILTGTYNNTTGNGLSAWAGSQSSMTETVVNLDAACNAVTGGTGGCAGQTIYIAFTGYSDALYQYLGWFIDDVEVTADVPGSCSATPDPLPFLTATATAPAGGGQVELQWLNPASGPYGSTTIRWSTTGFPATPTSGTALVDQVGTAGLPDLTTQTGLSSANTYYYSAFVKSGTSYSTVAQVAARPPVASSQVAWAYSSGASAMAPPGIGSVFAVSNDRAIHSMVPGSAGGAWPGSWTPHAMNGPSQDRPPVLPLSIVPGATKVVFVGSQDGYVYAFNGISGQELWSSPLLGEMVQAAPAGIFTAYGGAYDLLLVGSRDAAGDNSFYGLNPADGTIAWTFNNGGGSGGIGIISGTAAVDYSNDRVYFASRTRAGGSSNTLWCLSFTDAGATLLWARALGDIDGAPTLFNGRVYVGNNSGEVYAVNAVTGADVWSAPFATADGPIKGFITPRLGTGGLVFSTTNDVWGVSDNGAAASLSWKVTTVPSPSIPLLTPHSNDAYVGGSDGKLYQLDVSSATPLVTSLVLGDGTAAIGSPSYDVLHSLLYVGSDAGVVYGVSLPLP